MKDQFLQNELWTLTVGAAFQRAHIYKGNASEKDQKHLFNRYFRAVNVLTYPGTGIGLNIAKVHLENLGGNIKFKSKENQGSVFIVELPMIKE